MAAFQIGCGQPVIGGKADEILGALGLVHVVAQEAEGPRIGGREGIRADQENAGFGKARRIGGLDAIQVQRIAVAEREAVTVLVHQDTVIDATAHKAGALERFTAGRADHENRVFPFLELAHQVAPAGLAQNRRTQHRGVERTKPQFNIRIAGLFQADLVGTHHHFLHRALLDQRIPVECRLAGRRLCIDHRLAHLGRNDADLARHGSPGRHHHLVLGNHRHGGARNRVQPDHVVVRTGLADFQLVGHHAADVLVVEFQQFGLGNAEQQDRLGVLEDLDADKLAGQIHADQRHHRLAGVRRDIGDVGRQHDVAHGLLVGVKRFYIRRLALLFREGHGAREYVLAWQQRTHVGGRCQIGRQFRLVRL